MPIKVSCPACGNQFSAWEDLIGQTVGCPKCQAQVRVADPDAPADERAGEQEDDFVADQDDGSGDADGDADDEFRLSPVTELPKSLASDPLLPPGVESPGKPRPGAEAHDPGSPASQASDRPTHCPNCQAELPPDGMLCNECNYHLLLKRVLDSAIDSYEPDSSTGFSRWVNQQLDEGETPRSVIYWALGVALFFLVLFSFCCGFWVLIPAALLAAAGGGVYFLNKKSDGGLSHTIQATAKSAALGVLRALSWRSPDWPFPKLKSYSARGSDFSDDDVGNMSNTGEIQALDLEGCPITDAALVHLEDWRQLRYLVLTGTHVSPEAVKALSAKLRDTWIWSD